MYGEGGNRRNGILIVLGLLCFIGAAVLLHSFKGRFGQETAGKATVQMMPVMEDTIDVSPNAAAEQQSGGADGADTKGRDPLKEVWVVYVTGAVNKPGIYRIPSGSRVYQALDAAGGFAPDADREAVNLAAMLQDGSHIKFPAKGEPAPQQNILPSAPASGTGSSAGTDRSGHLININTAIKEDLEKLPGVGPKTAQLIINYREKNGAYKRKEDLLQIKGIGPAKYDAVKNLVTVAQ